jgi:hypothetical protein
MQRTREPARSTQRLVKLKRQNQRHEIPFIFIFYFIKSPTDQQNQKNYCFTYRKARWLQCGTWSLDRNPPCVGLPAELFPDIYTCFIVK